MRWVVVYLLLLTMTSIQVYYVFIYEQPTLIKVYRYRNKSHCKCSRLVSSAFINEALQKRIDVDPNYKIGKFEIEEVVE